MAEVRKNTNKYKYNVKTTKKNKNNKNKVKTTNVKVNKKESNTPNKSFWVRFRIFINGVKSEFKKVHWPTRKELIKYSIATFLFVIFLGIFFYLIDIIFAGIQALFK